MRKKLFSMLALLCLTAAGAWAQTEQTVDVTPVTGQTNQWTLAMPAEGYELAGWYSGDSEGGGSSDGTFRLTADPDWDSVNGYAF